MGSRGFRDSNSRIKEKILGQQEILALVWKKKIKPFYNSLK